MKCPKCDAWTRVLETRQHDSEHRTKRRMQCANGHKFNTVEVHEEVYCSAKPRQAQFLATLVARFKRRERDREIYRRLRAGDRGKDIAAALGVSEDLVSLVKRSMK